MRPSVGSLNPEECGATAETPPRCVSAAVLAKGQRWSVVGSTIRDGEEGKEGRRTRKEEGGRRDR